MKRNETCNKESQDNDHQGRQHESEPRDDELVTIHILDVCTTVQSNQYEYVGRRTRERITKETSRNGDILGVWIVGMYEKFCDDERFTEYGETAIRYA